MKTEKGGTLRRNRSALVTIGPRKNPETGHADTDDSATTQHSEVEDEETLPISNTENPPPPANNNCQFRRFYLCPILQP